jgi:heat shock protein HslJ
VPTTPAPEPPSIQSFSVAPTSIEQGQCVIASWSTGGGTTRVQLLRDKAVIWDNAPLNSSIQDCPPNTAPGTVAYSLVAYNNAGQKDQRDASVQVSAAPQQNPLANTSWVASSLQGSSVPSGIVVTAYFDADGTLTGSTGCNPYNTTYVISGSAITIALPLSTGALCGDPADTTAQTYLALLPQAKTFELGNGVLTLRDSQGQALVQYALLTPTPY